MVVIIGSSEKTGEDKIMMISGKISLDFMVGVSPKFCTTVITRVILGSYFKFQIISASIGFVF